MSAKFVVSKGVDSQYRFNLIAPNGQIILRSEPYGSKTGALNGIQTVRARAQNDGNYERRTASNGEPYFVLKALNGEVIGRSETYTSRFGMESGIAAVKHNADIAILVES